MRHIITSCQQAIRAHLCLNEFVYVMVEFTNIPLTSDYYSSVMFPIRVFIMNCEL